MAVVLQQPPSSPARHSASATVGSSSPENLTQPHPRPNLNHPPLNLPSLMVGPTVSLFSWKSDQELFLVLTCCFQRRQNPVDLSVDALWQI